MYPKHMSLVLEENGRSQVLVANSVQDAFPASTFQHSDQNGERLDHLNEAFGALFSALSVLIGTGKIYVKKSPPPQHLIVTAWESSLNL